jgi:hypothetical protein
MMFTSFLAFGGPPTNVPAEEELVERTLTLLKRTPLFRKVSRRLVTDVIAAHGFTEVDRAPGPLVLDGVQPAILVVVEGALEVRGPSHLLLQPGAYLRPDPPLVGINWANSKIESAEPERVRVFLLNIAQMQQLPRVVINALDLSALEAMSQTL